MNTGGNKTARRTRSSAIIPSSPVLPPAVQESLQTPLPECPGPWAAHIIAAAETLKQKGLVDKQEVYDALGVNKYWEYGKKATGAAIGNLESQMGGGGGRKRKPDEAQRDELRDLSQQEYCFDSQSRHRRAL